MQKGYAHSPIVGTSAMNTRLKALAILYIGNKITIHTSTYFNIVVMWLQSLVVKSITRHSVFYEKLDLPVKGWPRFDAKFIHCEECNWANTRLLASSVVLA